VPLPSLLRIVHPLSPLSLHKCFTWFLFLCAVDSFSVSSLSVYLDGTIVRPSSPTTEFERLTTITETS